LGGWRVVAVLGHCGGVVGLAARRGRGTWAGDSGLD
jgi:hypothetical protein